MIRAVALAACLACACTVDVELDPGPTPAVDAGPTADGDDRPLPPDAAVADAGPGLDAGATPDASR